MAGSNLMTGLAIVALLAFLFEAYLRNPIWLGLGIGRVMEPVSNFPYTCQKIVDPRMEACEDMWLSESTRQLFLACSDPSSRPLWMPNVGHLNLSARSQKDAVVVLDLEKPQESLFGLHTLKTSGWSGSGGDGLLDLCGFSGVDNPETGRVELFMVNYGPSVDPETGKYTDQLLTGSNTTLELFETGPDAQEMKHVHTYFDKRIATPNRVTAIDGGSFFITNDHGIHKSGLRHMAAPILGTGDVTFCQQGTVCRQVASGFRFPNGLVHGRNGLLYVPESMTGIIHIFKILADNSLEKVDEVVTGYSLDNLSVDSKGDIYAAAFPIGLEIYKAYKDPYNAHPPAAALRIRKENEGYVVEKIIEDATGEVLPGSTTVVHDAKTGRLFFSGVVAPFITVCNPKVPQV